MFQKVRNDMVQKVLYSKESPEEALANAAKQFVDEEIAAAVEVGIVNNPQRKRCRACQKGPKGDAEFSQGAIGRRTR